MKGELLMRSLTTGDALLFTKSAKSLYLVDAKHAAEWNASSKSPAVLRRMIKEDRIRRFTPRMLKTLHKAISRINFKL